MTNPAPDPDIILTPQEEHFCQLVANGLAQSKAYGQAINPDAAAATCIRGGMRLMKKAHIAARVETIQRARAATITYSLEDHIEQLKALRKEAQGKDQMNAAIQAEQAIGKALGFHNPKKPGAGKQRPLIVINRPARTE